MFPNRISLNQKFISKKFKPVYLCLSRGQLKTQSLSWHSVVANRVADLFKNSLNFLGQEGQAVGKGNIVQNKDNHFQGTSVDSCESLKHSEQTVVNLWPFLRTSEEKRENRVLASKEPMPLWMVKVQGFRQANLAFAGCGAI